VLELVHSDACAPLKLRSIGGALYFVTFIDDYSRKLCVERETEEKLKCI
jgi:hypothetical protein